MNVLVACEESQAVCTEFRKLGHNAFSCDIQKCSGGFPNWHILGDVRRILKPWHGENFIMFETQSLDIHVVKNGI